jgi:hypothetical protein
MKASRLATLWHMLANTCLQHALTADERRHFEELGYLVVHKALDSAGAA